MELEKTTQEYANWKAPEKGGDDSDKIGDQPQNLNQERIDIPQKYQGIPSEVVEEMWVDPQSVDESKNQQLTERRNKTIEAIKAQEQLREQNPSTQATIENTNAAQSQSEKEENSEKEQALKGQVAEFLKLVANDAGIRRTIDNFRAKTGTTETDLQILSKMDKSMYGLIHKSGMSYQEVINGIDVSDKENFAQTFNTEISGKLVDKVNESSKVRHITEQELIQGGQPDQAAGFVWFKGNALRPANAREVRFYLNASPDGTPQVAEHLSKLSDQLDKYGIRLQFKFRKDLGEYDRTDTCVAYLYMPEAETSEQKSNSDQWLEAVKSSLSQVPKEALRQKNSFFTEKIADGLSYAEDTREASRKEGESYTSQITKSISEACADVSGEFNALTPEAMSKISQIATEKLKSLNYI